jgi:hypothetical protein
LLLIPTKGPWAKLSFEDAYSTVSLNFAFEIPVFFPKIHIVTVPDTLQLVCSEAWPAAGWNDLSN